jgi:polyisoprenoid-binding protein YceI
MKPKNTYLILVLGISLLSGCGSSGSAILSDLKSIMEENSILFEEGRADIGAANGPAEISFHSEKDLLHVNYAVNLWTSEGNRINRASEQYILSDVETVSFETGGRGSDYFCDRYITGSANGVDGYGANSTFLLLLDSLDHKLRVSVMNESFRYGAYSEILDFDSYVRIKEIIIGRLMTESEREHARATYTNIMFAEENATFTANLDQSSCKWKGQRIDRIYHEGNINFKDAQAEIKDNKLTSMDFSIDMSSIDYVDIGMGEAANNLVRHLKSEDFFDVDMYPAATFETDSIVKSANQLFCYGKLQIKDVTKSERFQFEILENSVLKFVTKANIKFNRADYGVNFRSPAFFQSIGLESLGDRMIEDSVQLDISVTFEK